MDHRLVMLLFIVLAYSATVVAVATTNSICDATARDNGSYSSYFQGLKSVYGIDDNLYKCFMDCGWPQSDSISRDLPTLVVAVGLENAGQKMWMSAVFNSLIQGMPSVCSSDAESPNPYHINGDKNFPPLSSEELLDNLQKAFPAASGDKCSLMIDFSHSFPVAKKKHPGRVMRHGDLVALQLLHGVHFNVKYLVLIRNTADNAMVTLSRQSTKTMDHNLRSVEASLVYLEAALQRIPCHQKFLAHFEKFRADPRSFTAPLKSFLSLEERGGKLLEESIDSVAKQKKSLPMLKLPRQLVPMCSSRDSDKKCNKEVQLVYEKFFGLRSHMWPTFAGST